MVLLPLALTSRYTLVKNIDMGLHSSADAVSIN